MSLNGRTSRVEAACSRAAEYLLSRQSAGGGFCFYRSEHVDEPNLSDTFHALAALRLLGCEVPMRDQQLAFIRRVAPTKQPADLLHLADIARLLNPTDAVYDATRRHVRALIVSPAPPRDSAASSSWLTRTRVIAILQRRFDAFADAGSVRSSVESLMQDGGFGAGPNLVDTWKAVEILAACGGPLRLPGLLEFVDRLQVAALGFTMTTTSLMGRLEIVAAGVSCSRTLGLPLRYADDALRFVLACQTDRGGFADAPGALPDVGLTYQALATLLWLSRRE